MSEHQIERRAAEDAAQAEDTYRLRVTDAVLSDLVGVCDDSDFSMAVTVQAGTRYEFALVRTAGALQRDPALASSES